MEEPVTKEKVARAGVMNPLMLNDVDSSEDVRRQTKKASMVTEQVQLLREPVEYVFWLNGAQ